MARAPIIISNGGVLSALAKGVAQKKNQRDAERQIKRNLINLLKSDRSKLVIIKDADENVPYAYWRLKSEGKFENKVPKDPDYPNINKGKEGFAIDELLGN